MKEYIQGIVMKQIICLLTTTTSSGASHEGRLHKVVGDMLTCIIYCLLNPIRTLCDLGM